MSNQCVAVDRDQRNRQCVGRPQPRDDVRFGLVAVLHAGKGPRRNFGDGGVIALLFLSYQHRSEHSRCLLSSGKACHRMVRLLGRLQNIRILQCMRTYSSAIDPKRVDGIAQREGAPAPRGERTSVTIDLAAICVTLCM